MKQSAPSPVKREAKQPAFSRYGNAADFHHRGRPRRCLLPGQLPYTTSRCRPAFHQRRLGVVRRRHPRAMTPRLPVRQLSLARTMVPLLSRSSGRIVQLTRHIAQRRPIPRTITFCGPGPSTIIPPINGLPAGRNRGSRYWPASNRPIDPGHTSTTAMPVLLLAPRTIAVSSAIRGQRPRWPIPSRSSAQWCCR